MKIFALDVGDVWTGSAISDPLKILARPYKTVQTKDLTSFITQLLQIEPIETIIVGYPQTLKGTVSKQTEKVLSMFADLESKFPTCTWQLWDERLTSKHANRIKQAKTKQEKIDAHSIAAALILDSYLSYLQMQKSI